jgi:hypothetical protein
MTQGATGKSRPPIGTALLHLDHRVSRYAEEPSGSGVGTGKAR